MRERATRRIKAKEEWREIKKEEKISFVEFWRRKLTKGK